MQYIISDLDSTIADIDHRLPLICGDDLELRGDADWPEFFRRCVYDAPIKPVISLLRRMAEHHEIVIVTGRSDEVRRQTEAWLDHYRVPYHQLLMRPAGSRRADHKLKPELVRDAGISPGEVLFALEDRKRVVDAWRGLGIQTFQVAPGDF